MAKIKLLFLNINSLIMFDILKFYITLLNAAFVAMLQWYHSVYVQMRLHHSITSNVLWSRTVLACAALLCSRGMWRQKMHAIRPHIAVKSPEDCLRRPLYFTVYQTAIAAPYSKKTHVFTSSIQIDRYISVLIDYLIRTWLII